MLFIKVMIANKKKEILVERNKELNNKESYSK